MKYQLGASNTTQTPLAPNENNYSTRNEGLAVDCSCSVDEQQLAVPQGNAITVDVDNKRHLSDTAGPQYHMQCETRSVLRMPLNDIPASHSDASVCINALHSLPTQIVDDLLDMETSARHHVLLNSSFDAAASSVNAVTTRAQARKEASKQAVTDKVGTDLNHSPVSDERQQNVPYEHSLNENIKLYVVQNDVSTISVNAFVCECDGNLNPKTDVAVSIVNLGCDHVRQQCNEYIEQHGIIAGPEVVYTQ